MQLGSGRIRGLMRTLRLPRGSTGIFRDTRRDTLSIVNKASWCHIWRPFRNVYSTDCRDGAKEQCIVVEATPNNNNINFALKDYRFATPGQLYTSCDARENMAPLARNIFERCEEIRQGSIVSIFIGESFVSVNKHPNCNWDSLQAAIQKVLTNAMRDSHSFGFIGGKATNVQKNGEKKNVSDYPFSTLEYSSKDRIAYVTLNRPEQLNAINETMPAEISQAVERANQDDNVRVIVISGKGRSFCSGYDLEIYAEAPRPVPGSQEMPWDPMVDFQLMYRNTKHFMSLFHSDKPTICKVHGFAVAGGSDIALCCDFVVMGTEARIGYPPARVWGCPTTAMWIYRLGMEQAKKMLLTGRIITGHEAERIGLIAESVADAQLDSRVEELASDMAQIPTNQLMMHKMLINQSYSNMGIESTQRLATVFDGMARHTPEGIKFKDNAEKFGFKEAVARRNRGEF
eukprot:gb/GECG01006462.1/.p1 GENE.gb/GECG01006462.1/~~gb/GECG01006462.1/.p1  ORF type:complete len:458 (+),score=39.79 gb/GECG01006462.1/:1-1374(+)